MEFKKKKEIIYLVNRTSTCTYELDDTPPFLVNEQGLDIAIELALLVNCSIVDELHITRKQYLDGSIPTGFQRTGIVGVEGWVPVDGKRVGVIQLSYEEDSCREVSDIGHTITYRPDRLGMPLIEVVTYPDMHHPVEVARTVEVIGRLLRVSGKVRRGIGSVRQDVNVSVRGGTRIEIKGVPRIPMIPILVHNEAVRQWQLLKLRTELHQRGMTTLDSVVGNEADVTLLFKDTTNEVLRDAIARGQFVRAICVKGVSGLAEFPTQPGKKLLDEIKGRLRVVACLDVKPHTMCTVDFADHGIDQNTVDKLHRLMNATDRDTVFVVWGNERDSKLGCSEILLRWREATLGVPPETRQHFPDGTTDYERTLPGPERMYPDTDHPPRQLGAERIDKIRSGLPSRPWDREAHMRSLGLPEHLVYHLAISARYGLFCKAVDQLALSPVFLATTLYSTLKSLSRKGFRTAALPDDALFEILSAVASGRILHEAVDKAIAAACEQPASSPEQILGEGMLMPVADSDAAVVLKGAFSKAEPLHFERPDQRDRFIMGTSMHELRGIYPGSKLYSMMKSH
jgi:glutamyl-tRNA(Gln) amidotransferase subunit E